MDRLRSTLFPSNPTLACYAVRADTEHARFVAEAPSLSRTDLQRDRDRIIHATAFRRLALKTQVFLPEAGDHYRTRLTHTIEVAQIARTLTRALGLNDDLGEALALAHDLGHTPFGHTGEDALSEALGRFGGFDHNAQTLRIVVALERRYPRFLGLNLTWDSIDGLIKRIHSGVLNGNGSRWYLQGLPCFADSAWTASFAETPRPSGEAQCAALADDIAYNAHDLEDGLQAELFGLADLDDVPFLASIRDRVATRDPDLGDALLIRGLARELVGLFVEDAIGESRRRLDLARPDSAMAIRGYEQDLVALSDPLLGASSAIKAFLFRRMYRHPRLLEQRSAAGRIVSDLAHGLLADPSLLPSEWKRSGDDGSEAHHARVVADYIAGMTDRYAVAEHRRLFDATPELR